MLKSVFSSKSQRSLAAPIVLRTIKLAGGTVFIPNVASNSKKMMRIVQILIFCFCVSTFSQTVPDAVTDFAQEEIHKDYGKELKLEFIDAFKKSNDQFAINLDSADTLFIIRGIDVQNRVAYGRIWNTQLELHYTDSKKWENNNIIGPNVEISRNEEDSVTDNFNPIIKWVENGNFKCVDKYAAKHKVFSGVSWTILRAYRNNGKIIIDSHNVPDFDTN